MCSQLELRTGGGNTFFQELRDCNGPNGCGVNEDQLYHLAASGLFEGIRVTVEGRHVVDLYGGKLAAFVAQYEARREHKIKVTHETSYVMLGGLDQKMASMEANLKKITENLSRLALGELGDVRPRR